ncbi:hypothetical protein RFI_08670, partial [Reticulomyxa filosa]
RKKVPKLGTVFSSELENLRVCTAIDESGLYVFACGFDDLNIVVWDIARGEVVQTLKRHTQLVSCLALDEDAEKDNRLLVTGSYDNTVMVWRLQRRHSVSLSSRKALTEIIDPEPRFVLTKQSAKVLLCFLFPPFFFFAVLHKKKKKKLFASFVDHMCRLNLYNASTGDHLEKLKPLTDVEQAIANERLLHVQVKKEPRTSASASASASPLALPTDPTKIAAASPVDASPNATNDPNKDTVKLPEEDAIITQRSTIEDSNEMMNSKEEENEKELLLDVRRKSKSTIAIVDGMKACLNIVRVSAFGDIVCYGKDLKHLCVYSSNGELVKKRVVKDVLSVIEFSNDGNYIVTGGHSTITLIRDTRTLRIRKQFPEAKEMVKCITLDKDEVFMFVGITNGDVLIYSLSMSRFVNRKIATLGELGVQCGFFYKPKKTKKGHFHINPNKV